MNIFSFASIGCVTMLSSMHLVASIEPVPFHKVEMTSDFWRPRLITQRKVLVPFAFEKTKPGVAHLQAAADYLAGKKVEDHRPHRFIDSDLYKVMEGAAYLAQLQDDPELESLVDYDLVRSFAIVGTPKEAAEQLKEILNLGFTQVSCNLASVRRSDNTMAEGLEETIKGASEALRIVRRK